MLKDAICGGERKGLLGSTDWSPTKRDLFVRPWRPEPRRTGSAWEQVEGVQGDCEHELPVRFPLPLGKSHWPQPRKGPRARGQPRRAQPGPRRSPPPRGWRHARAASGDKAGQGSAPPNQGGAAATPAPLLGLQPCLFQLFKLFQSARTRETFGKQLLISRAESVSFTWGRTR